jgi:fluoride exporter
LHLRFAHPHNFIPICEHLRHLRTVFFPPPSSMQKSILIFLGSGLGGVLRYALSSAVQRWHGGPFPLGTLAVNLLGCFVLGLLTGLFAAALPLRDEYRLALTVGLLGGFTTFSAFGQETHALLRDGHAPHAALNIALHIAAGLAAVYAGHRAATLWS